MASGPNQRKPSLVQFRLDDAIAADARARVGDLLSHHPLYPEGELWHNPQRTTRVATPNVTTDPHIGVPAAPAFASPALRRATNVPLSSGTRALQRSTPDNKSTS